MPKILTIINASDINYAMKSEASTLKVFVYGTLKPGEANYSYYYNGDVESQAIAYAKGISYALLVGYSPNQIGG